MPFGRFKGELIANLPNWYLNWVADLPDLREPLYSSVLAEVARRDAEETETDDDLPGDCPNLQVADELVNAGFKALARRHHPDLPGGSTEHMQEINLVTEWLRRQLKRISSC